MSDYDWFDGYEQAANASGDPDRMQLARMHREAYRFRETDPDQAMALLESGRQIALRLKEPWWVLYYDQQRVHALLHFKQDYREVLALAVRAAAELSKKSNANYPRRLLIYLDLVASHLGIDPVGRCDLIKKALDYLDCETPPYGDERYMLLGLQRQFALDLNDLKTAESLTDRMLALAAEDSSASRARHFSVFAYSGLCEIHWRRGDVSAIAETAMAGEETARTVGHQMELAGFILWRAVALQMDGRVGNAGHLYQRAASRMGRLCMPPDYSYRDAECAYLELAGRLEHALEVRNRELATISNRGRLAYEVRCHLHRCDLKFRLGILTPSDLAVAQQALDRLCDSRKRLEKGATG